MNSKQTRQISALKRLEAQLASGKKKTSEGMVVLTEMDKKESKAK